MSTRADDVKQIAATTVESEERLAACVDALAASARRDRQNAASVVAAVARIDAQKLVPYGTQIVEALEVPEAQTRWEVLDALTELCAFDSRVCDKAVDGAEGALFDEDSGPLRLAAMKFLCRLGSTTPARSDKAWGLIDEGIQCYHGDLEFPDMLTAVNDFAGGKISPHVKSKLYARLRFDAENGKGGMKKRAQQIIESMGDVEIIEEIAAPSAE